jgi:hypothetical protein
MLRFVRSSVRTDDVAQSNVTPGQGRAGEPFWGRVPKLYIHFDEILSRASGKCEEQNKVLQSSIVITNYCIISNAYYN